MLKNNKVGRLTLPNVSRTVWCWHKDRNRIESPEKNPSTCGQLIFNKGAKPFNKGKKSPSTNGAGMTGYEHIK